MSSLKSHEKVVLDRIFTSKEQGLGYVLNFTNPSFSEFFREHKINIDSDKYQINGTSKMKRLRAFWEVEPDAVVSGVIKALLEYGLAVGQITTEEKNQVKPIIERLKPQAQAGQNSGSKEEDFLSKSFDEVNLGRLKLDIQLEPVIKQRINEIHLSLKVKAPLATIFLCGSTLEGLLQDAASKQAQAFNQAKAAHKDKNGKVIAFNDWTLESLINVAHEIGLLSLDVKKYGHSLRDFRNYIHPRQQAAQGFNPDLHTAKISWQVLQAAIADLSKQRK